MTVLVCAASRHGATAEIAESIGATLARHGIPVEVRAAEQVTLVDVAALVEATRARGHRVSGGVAETLSREAAATA